MVKSSPCRSRAENVLIFNTLFNTLFEKVADIKGFRPYTETQKSHREGEAIVSPSLFRETHKGFQRIHSTENKGNNSAISSIHFQYTFNTLLFVHHLFYMQLGEHYFEKKTHIRLTTFINSYR